MAASVLVVTHWILSHHWRLKHQRRQIPMVLRTKQTAFSLSGFIRQNCAYMGEPTLLKSLMRLPSVLQNRRANPVTILRKKSLQKSLSDAPRSGRFTRFGEISSKGLFIKMFQKPGRFRLTCAWWLHFPKECLCFGLGTTFLFTINDV